MKKVGVEINGVLRDTVTKFKQLYEKHLIDKDDIDDEKTYSLDLSGNTEEIEVITEDNFKYEVLSEVTSLELNTHFAFKTNEEYFQFMYEDYTMELFGHAPSTEYSTFNDLNDLYLELRDKLDLSIVSDEISKSKPASLFFLSKFGCLLEKFRFYSNITLDDMWNDVDILVTSNPNLLLNQPKGKTVIKFETQYNSNIENKHTVKTIKELKVKLKELI
jgi:thiamine pyrophosphokinase